MECGSRLTAGYIAPLLIVWMAASTGDRIRRAQVRKRGGGVWFTTRLRVGKTMATEIERKFQVLDDRWRKSASAGSVLKQAYLVATKNRTLRVRTIDAERATLTAKFRRGHMTREEYEYAIPYSDALQMFEFALGIVEKTRYEVRCAEHLWHIDVYSGENIGLVVAEVELRNRWDDPPHPQWLGAEITGNPLYSNRALAMRSRAACQRPSSSSPVGRSALLRE